MSQWLLESATAEFGRFANDWDQLNQELYHTHPMFDSRFIGALLRHFGTPGTLMAVHRQHGGMLLLEATRSNTWASFLPAQLQAAPMMLPPQQYADLASLFRNLPGFPIQIDWLAQDPSYSPCQNRSNTGDTRQFAARTMAIDLQGSFSCFWSLRSKNLRKNIKRYLNRISENHQTATLQTYTAATDMEEVLNRYSDLESAGWKGRHGTAIERNNKQWYFYREVLQRYAQSSQAHVYELQLDGRVVASRLTISGGGMLVILKTTYDETFKELAVGRVLLYKLLEQEFSQQHFQRIEFYTNATPDQLEWATESRAIEHVTTYRSSLYANSIMLARRLRNIVRKLRGEPS